MNKLIFLAIFLASAATTLFAKESSLGICYIMDTKTMIQNIQGFNCQTKQTCHDLRTECNNKTNVCTVTKSVCCPESIKIITSSKTMTIQNHGGNYNVPSNTCIYGGPEFDKVLECTVDNACTTSKSK